METNVIFVFMFLGASSDCSKYFNSAAVSSCSSLVDPTLRGLALQLPGVIRDKWCSATTLQYESSFKGWTEWASKFEEVDVLPVQPLHLCLYLISLAQRAVSIAKLNSAIAGIAWMHKINGLDSPTLGNTVSLCIDGLKRRLAKPVSKALPILPAHIACLVKTMDMDSLTDLRVCSLIVLAFSGFLRFNELVNLRLEDLNFLSTYMILNITSSKTDQLRKGHLVHIARTGSPCCPVSLLERYMAKAEFSIMDKGFVFRNFSYQKGSVLPRDVDKKMTYTRVREIVKQKFIAIGLDTKSYTLHSLRSGGASAAARNNVPDRLFQRHGRWRTDSIKNSYLEESTDNLLMVSQNLGL
jgi:integrase